MLTLISSPSAGIAVVILGPFVIVPLVVSVVVTLPSSSVSSTVVVDVVLAKVALAEPPVVALYKLIGPAAT